MIIFFLQLKQLVLGVILVINLAVMPTFIFATFQLHDVDASCVKYEKDRRTILVNCKSTNMNDVYEQVDDETVLSKQPNGVWLLNASMVVENGARLQIDSSDTSWLKISSDGIHAFGIIIFGSLIIDSVKITSWDATINDVASINEDRTPRPFIRIERDAPSNTNITNSEIAYLGYNAPKSKGINYHSGNGSALRGNNIHHLYFGVYIYKLDNILVEGNDLHHNLHYGIDPHTSPNNIIIRNNNIHHNGGQGIICSLDCDRIIIENNEVYDNTKAGIMFSRNMQNSIVRGNNIHDEVIGIFVSSSHNNNIYNNTVSDSRGGILLKADSSSNYIFNNTIINPRSSGLRLNDGASNNTFYSNTIIGAPKDRSVIIEDSKTEANVFRDNKIS